MPPIRTGPIEPETLDEFKTTVVKSVAEKFCRLRNDVSLATNFDPSVNERFALSTEDPDEIFREESPETKSALVPFVKSKLEFTRIRLPVPLREI